MYLLAKLGGHRIHGNMNMNSYINSNMITSEKAEPISSLCRFTIPSPRYAWQENDEKNLGSCKVLQVSRKRNQQNLTEYFL